MNHRSNSFFISFVIHFFILLSALFLYNSVTLPKKEQRVPINLCQCVASSCKCNSNSKPEVQEVTTTPMKKEKQISQRQTQLQQEQVTKLPIKQIIPQNISQASVKKEVQIEQDSLVVVQNNMAVSTSSEKQIISKPTTQESKNTKTFEQKQYMQTNFSAIMSMLQENFYYPMSARKRDIQGEVVVKFTLLKNSTIKDIIIVKSPQEILSKATITTIESLSGKLPAPAEEIVLELPINYSLH